MFYLYSTYCSGPIESPPKAKPMNDVLGRAQSLLAFSTDLDRRLSSGSMGSVPGLVDRFHELRRELDAVDGARLSSATRDIHGLIEALGGVAEQVDHLLSIKRAFIDGRTQEETVR